MGGPPPGGVRPFGPRSSDDRMGPPKPGDFAKPGEAPKPAEATEPKLAGEAKPGETPKDLSKEPPKEAPKESAVADTPPNPNGKLKFAFRFAPSDEVIR